MGGGHKEVDQRSNKDNSTSFFSLASIIDALSAAISSYLLSANQEGSIENFAPPLFRPTFFPVIDSFISKVLLSWAQREWIH